MDTKKALHDLFYSMEYGPTKRWCRYLNGASRHFRWGIYWAKPDARCAAMFDREIEAQAAQMKADVLCQKYRHLEQISIFHQQIQGNRTRTEQWLQDLKQDLKELETELEVLQAWGK